MTTYTRTLQDELTIFMEAWNGVKVNMEDDFITYKVAPGYGKKAAYNANILCRDLGLHLIAEASGLPIDNSFCVKGK